MPAIIRVVGKQTIIKVGESTAAASRSALVAQLEAAAAALSSATAESAAGPTYPNVAAGLAATTSGQSFAVDNGDGTVTVYLNNAGVAVAQRTLATTDYLASATGSSAVGVATGRTLGDELKSFRTPRALGGAPGTTDGVNQNVLVGGIGTFSSAPASPRASWDALGADPTIASNSLNLTGHAVVNACNSAQIIGGRVGYYSAVGSAASNPAVNGFGSLTVTYGGDNWNSHLAGQNLSMHSDLMQGTGVDGVTAKGSHGFILGGSFHQVAGDYSGSIGGQMKQVFALQSISLGGRNTKMGTLANVDAVRRSGMLGGLMLFMDNAEESVMLGGKNNTLTGSQSAIIAGQDTTVSVLRGISLAARDSEVTAEGGAAMGRGVKANVTNALTKSAGAFAARGDSQTHHVEARRSLAGPNVFLSLSGGSGVDIFTPEANTTGIATFEVVIQEASVSVSNMASYVLSFAYSNMGGTLVIKGQNLITLVEDNAAFNCAAEIAGAGTRLAIRVTAPNTNTYRTTATGRIVVNRI